MIFEIHFIFISMNSFTEVIDATLSYLFDFDSILGVLSSEFWVKFNVFIKSRGLISILMLYVADFFVLMLVHNLVKGE